MVVNIKKVSPIAPKKFSISTSMTTPIKREAPILPGDKEKPWASTERP